MIKNNLLSNKYSILTTFIAILFTVKVMGQDSINVLDFETYMSLVLRNHPVAKQANLLSNKAKQEIRIARAGFDPLITGDYYHKEFESQEHFDMLESYLTVPTWFGTSFKTGYAIARGFKLSSVDETPPEGWTYVGISTTVFQGLVIDERRAALKQALLFPQLAEAEQLKQLNKLLLNAAKQYWDWQNHFKVFVQYSEGFKFASERFKATQERMLLGDLAAIDTVEANIQMLNIEVLYNESILDYKNTSLGLSNFLWDASNNPLEINNSIIPDDKPININNIDKNALDTLRNFAIINHPDLTKLQIKIKQLEIEKRLNTNKLLPKLTVNYGLQQRGFYNQPGVPRINYSVDNFIVGAYLYMPVFLRQERGKLQMTKLKLLENTYELDQTNRVVINEVTMVYNEYINLAKLIVIQRKLVNNAERLRTAELIKFDNGESSVFLINSRDMLLINSKLKLFALEAKYQKSRNELTWSAGQLLR